MSSTSCSSSASSAFPASWEGPQRRRPQGALALYGIDVQPTPSTSSAPSTPPSPPSSSRSSLQRTPSQKSKKRPLSFFSRRESSESSSSTASTASSAVGPSTPTFAPSPCSSPSLSLKRLSLFARRTASPSPSRRERPISAPLCAPIRLPAQDACVPNLWDQDESRKAEEAELEAWMEAFVLEGRGRRAQLARHVRAEC